MGQLLSNMMEMIAIYTMACMYICMYVCSFRSCRIGPFSPSSPRGRSQFDVILKKIALKPPPRRKGFLRVVKESRHHFLSCPC